MIRDPEAVFEAAYQAGWDKLADGAVLTDTEGTRVQILSRGEWNHEAGPDFRNAKIRRLGKILRGDIELHRKSSDYIRHGHLADAAYGNVILHVVAEDDLAGKVNGTALAHIPTCRLSPEAVERRAGTACRCRIFPYMCGEQLRNFFNDAGLERLQLKSASILEKMICSGTGSAFRQALFRAAGYKRNQDAFLELFRRLEKYPPEIFEKHFEALLWGESSLLPDPANETLPERSRRLVRRLWDEFWSIRLEAEPPVHWHRDSVRPLNTPERRIAMIAAFVRRFTTDPLPSLAAKLAVSDPHDFLDELRKKLVFADPFWDCRCTFHSAELPRKAAVLGQERAETLLIDVVTPALLAYAKLNGSELPECKAAGLLPRLAAQRNNRVFKNAVRRWLPGNDERLKIFDQAAAVQGCLHIYKQYCAGTAGDCVSCLLANSPN